MKEICRRKPFHLILLLLLFIILFRNREWHWIIKRIKSVLDRHILMSSGPLLTPEQWEVCGVACYRACSNSLQELHQLTMAFSPRSESFYGDVAQVKVAARRDATPEETERLRQLAAQVSNPRFMYLWEMRYAGESIPISSSVVSNCRTFNVLCRCAPHSHWYGTFGIYRLCSNSRESPFLHLSFTCQNCSWLISRAKYNSQSNVTWNE